MSTLLPLIAMLECPMLTAGDESPIVALPLRLMFLVVMSTLDGVIVIVLPPQVRVIFVGAWM